MTSPNLEFGFKDPAQTYKDRPAAFGVAVQDGRVALVKVSKPGQAPWHDLPGGAVEPGEAEDRAVAREFGEETGLIVRPGETLDRAAQYFLSEGKPYRNVGPLLSVQVVGTDAGLKIEDDHELVWIAPDEAVRVLRHDSHAWAVACWLRREPSER